MSFNNHLAFNISKASATTSTTNTTTTSISGNVKAISTSATESSRTENLNGLGKLPSPKLTSSEQAEGTTGNSPANVSAIIGGVDSLSMATLETHKPSRDGQELLEIWGKYDLTDTDGLNKNQSSGDNVDLLEQDKSQIQLHSNNRAIPESPNLSSLDLDEKKPHDTVLEHVDPKLRSEILGALDMPDASQDLLDIFEGSSEQLSPEEQSEHVSSGIEGGAKKSAPITVAPVRQPRSQSLREATNHKVPSSSDIGIQPYSFPEDSQPNEEGLSAEIDSVAQFGPQTPPESLTSKPITKRHNSITRITAAVNPKEQHRQSHKPFDFQVFLAHLKNKRAAPLVKYIQSFLVSFSRQSNVLTASQMIKAVKNFKEFMNAKFLEYEPFASMDAVDLENSDEGVEKLIMNRLYDYCFSPEAIKKFGKNSPQSVFKDVHQDYEFSLQLEKFSWVLAVHLDIELETFSQKLLDARGSIEYIDYAATELNKINKYRAPRDKIICVLNACKIIFNLLENSRQETNADSFIPILIIVIIRAKTDNLFSNIVYIESYRGEEWLNHGETSYYLSSMQAAISFIQKIRKEDLTIDEGEYEANMEAWEAELRQRGPPVAYPEPIGVDKNSPVAQESISPSNVILASAEMFTKSISSFMSPSPLLQSADASSTPQRPEVTDGQIDNTVNQLAEIFPSLDRDVIRDVVAMKKADFDASLDICLQLCSDN